MKHNAVLVEVKSPTHEGYSHMVSEVQCDIVRYRAEGTKRVGRCESIKVILAYIRDDCAKRQEIL